MYYCDYDTKYVPISKFLKDDNDEIFSNLVATTDFNQFYVPEFISLCLSRAVKYPAHSAVCY